MIVAGKDDVWSQQIHHPEPISKPSQGENYILYEKVYMNKTMTRIYVAQGVI
jgi:hypothetical protein